MRVNDIVCLFNNIAVKPWLHYCPSNDWLTISSQLEALFYLQVPPLQFSTSLVHLPKVMTTVCHLVETDILENMAHG